MLWDLVDTPATVAVLALTPEGEAVMVEQYRPGPQRLVLSLPGGIVDPGETPEEAARRELLEETGYAAGSLTVVGEVRPPSATRPWHAALARDCVRVADQRLDDFEDIGVRLLRLPELREGLRSGALGAIAQTYLALDHAGLL